MVTSTSGSEILFTTSGSTGSPMRWYRTVEQLRTEVTVVAGELGRIEQIVNFAPTGHLFGHLYGIVLPEVIDVPVHHGWRDPSAVPAARPDVATLLVCLPSSWPIVRSMVRFLAELPSVVALHGTGPVIPTTRVVIDRLDAQRFRAVEIFGSTETGAIATRAITGDPTELPWELLPDVELVAGPTEGPQPLVVRSPRLARLDSMSRYPEVLQLDDLVKPQPARQFVHLGRASRLIKVNGVRCDLTQIEEKLALLFPGCDLVCVADIDALRGEHYDLYYSAPDSGPIPEQIWSTYQRALGSVPLPRRVHRLESIPRSPMGKALFEQLSTHGQENSCHTATSRVNPTDTAVTEPVIDQHRPQNFPTSQRSTA